MTTLKDVARASGVSTATVSRVLSGNGYVSKEVRKRVESVIVQLHYQPNGIARSLRSAKTQTIGVLVPDISNPYFMDLIRSFEEVVSAENYNIVIGSSSEKPEKEKKLIEVFLEKQVDALVLATSRDEISDSVQRCQQQNVPLMLVDRSISGLEVDTIVEENVNGAYELVKYLIAAGHRKIAIINGTSPISTVLERQRGFELAMKDHHLPIPDGYVQQGGFNQESGYILCKRLLKLGSPPTAIFCSNNFIAVGLIVAVNELGLSIPEDISVVSFGELLVPELIRPRLTAVIQDPVRVGSITGRLLLEKLERDSRSNVESITLSTHIRLGDSVRILSAVDV